MQNSNADITTVCNKKEILVLCNNDGGLYRFRRGLLIELLKNYRVSVSCPKGIYTDELVKMGVEFINTPIDRRGTNPIRDLGLIRFYRKLIKKRKPLAVLTYTIKPNIYGGIVCRLLKLKTAYIPNITGVGTAVEDGGTLRKMLMLLYKTAVKGAYCVFFQNEANKAFFEQSMSISRAIILCGSGVDLGEYAYAEYPVDSVDSVDSMDSVDSVDSVGLVDSVDSVDSVGSVDSADSVDSVDSVDSAGNMDGAKLRLLFIGRVMRAKGIEELIYTAQKLHSQNANVEFTLLGGCDEHTYNERLQYLTNEGILNWVGEQRDVYSYIRNCHGVVHPSYHEGMSNVLLEAAATGRPVIASDIPGCREAFINGISGIAFEPKNAEALYNAVREFMGLSHEARMQMGIKGREHIERNFDRQSVINAYIDILKELM